MGGGADLLPDGQADFLQQVVNGIGIGPEKGPDAGDPEKRGGRPFGKVTVQDASPREQKVNLRRHRQVPHVKERIAGGILREIVGLDDGQEPVCGAYQRISACGAGCRQIRIVQKEHASQKSERDDDGNRGKKS